jgi:adenylate cyclase
MTLTTATRRKLTTIASVTIVSMMFGLLYPIILFTPHQSNAPAWHSNLNGLLMGLLIGIAVSLGELHLFQTRLRRLRFSGFLVVQTLYYLVAINISIIIVVSTHMVLFHGLTFGESFQSSTFKDFYQDEFLRANAYALVVIFTLNFVRQVNRMLGQNALFNFIIGKYHKPVEEERVFMFLDLKDSTTIAEKLGNKRYHQFLNDFFYDITPAIVESKGEIYQYVGDEVVVTWTKERGLREANCISCYFGVAAAIAQVSDKYERRYGFVPTFKAGYHFGAVITGLIGDIKRDIVFHGDTVNTASRIRSECTAVDRPLLLSGDLLKRLSITTYLTPENMGKIKLRGKEEEIELFAIREAA